MCIRLLNDDNASSTKINLVIEGLMNILDSEEMQEAEQLLLTLEPHQPYTFLPPEPSLLPALRGFNSQLFPPPPEHIQQQSQRFITNPYSLRSLKKEDPNACLKVFTRFIFALAFPSNSSHNPTQKFVSNDSLLDTLKCSLFSRDFNFSHASNQRFKVENYQAKAMMARFLAAIRAKKQWTNGEKISYIEWSLEKNGVLMDLFTLFYRIILAKLQVQGADDYNRPLNFGEAITNLMEYFDINYRNLGEVFIISEEKFFLSLTNGYLVMGQYTENNDDSRSKEAIKAPENKNNLQSSSKQAQRKAPGVLQNDLKLFNFMLESGGDSYNAYEKDGDSETPHFKDSNQFAFGRKRRKESLQLMHQMHQEEIRKEFEQFFMNSSAESFQMKKRERASSADYGLPQLQEIASKEQFERCADSGETPKEGLRMSILDETESLIDQLDEEISNQLKINPQVHHVKKNVPLCQQSFKLQKPKEDDIMSQKTCLRCRCFQNKRKRNMIVSKVVQFHSKEPKAYRAPKFLQNLKASQNINIPKINLHPKQTQELRMHTKSEYIQKPLFTKPPRRERQGQKSTIQSKSQSKCKIKSKMSMQENFLSPQHKYDFVELDRQMVDRINNHCTAFSTIISKNPLDIKSNEIFSKSPPNKSLSPNKRPSMEQPNIKNFDSRYPNYRPGLGSSWKPPNIPNMLNFQQKPKEQNMQNKPDKVQVYAPVHIIAPTVYFSTNNDPNNRVVFTVNETMRDKGQQMKREAMMRTEPAAMYATRHERFMSGHQNQYI